VRENPEGHKPQEWNLRETLEGAEVEEYVEVV